ncbi:MAG: glycoside hydrolase family 13 protein [Oscillospiraceae bacterium]|nr:glycoside hydrolase family 13 protein [Oscillospiraceae bacterium]
MDEIMFDSRCELDKLPFGAVSAGTSVRFGVRASESLNISVVKLILINDTNGQVSASGLSPVWTEHGFTRFEGSFTFETKGLFWYHFTAVSGGTERVIEKKANGAGFAGGEPCSWQQTVYSPDYTTPEWIKGGAFYHIFVDRFKKSGGQIPKPGTELRNDWGGIPNYKPDENGEIRNSDFFGGNLDGVIEKLPYLHRIGISCIYLSPIFEAASNHKYDTADYLKIDPSFGDDEAFRHLCCEAGKLGIRIICDGVFNHTGSDSLYFNRSGNYGEGGAYRDQSSEYYEWYTFTEWPDKYDSWWGVKTLPQVKKESLSFRSFITGDNGVLEKWMSLGAGGWRLDVADELSESFLKELRRTVKSKNSDALIIGEVWEDASNKVAYGARRHYFEGEELDGVMNYPFKDAIIAFIMGGTSENLRETVESICENYPRPALDCLMNILGTHDTERILTVLSGKHYNTRNGRAAAILPEGDRMRAKFLLRLASVLQFTLPGVPCIYYGDEAGSEGYEDPFNRVCYPWGSEDRELIDWYAKLLSARKSCPAFAGGDYRTLRAQDGVFIFARNKNGFKAVVAVNKGEGNVSLELGSGDRSLIQFGCTESAGTLVLRSGGCAVIETPE